MSYLIQAPIYKTLKGKAIPVTGHESPYSCETSRLPDFLDQWYSTWGTQRYLTEYVIFKKYIYNVINKYIITNNIFIY
jgi:hypothetical protein